MSDRLYFFGFFIFFVAAVAVAAVVVVDMKERVEHPHRKAQCGK
jgi:hypothetical protein